MANATLGRSGRWLAVLSAAMLLGANPALSQPAHGGGGHAGGGAHAGGAHGGGGHSGAGRGGGAPAHFAPSRGGYAPGAHAAVRGGGHAGAAARPVAHYSPSAHSARGGYYGPRGGGGRPWSHPRGGGWWPWWSTGVFFVALPLYYNSFWWDGVPYYYGDHRYYVWNPDVSEYEVVPPPQAADPGAAGAAAEPEELYAYPAEGQSGEQLAKDRAECRRWAEGQGRPESGGGALRRAETACLEGRGYSVQ